MDTKTRTFVAILGGIFCATVGSLLVGLVVALIRAARGISEDATTVLAFFPIAVAFAAVPAAPFGLIVGSIGTWWLAVRANRILKGRLYFESALLGAIFGATFPLIMPVLGWGPFNNLLSALPISIGIGIVCGLCLASLLRRYVAKYRST